MQQLLAESSSRDCSYGASSDVVAEYVWWKVLKSGYQVIVVVLSVAIRFAERLTIEPQMPDATARQASSPQIREMTTVEYFITDTEFALVLLVRLICRRSQGVSWVAVVHAVVTIV
jgi:hypothetical protein